MGGKLVQKLQKYQFLLIFLAAGTAFLTLSRNWELYGNPIREVRREVEKLLGAESAGSQGDNSEIPKGKNPGFAEGGGSDGPQDPVEDGGLGISGGGNSAGEQAGEGDPEGSGLPCEREEGPVQSTEPKELTFQSVGEEYFADALFIGDSRTVALRDYGKFGDGPAFYASKGLTIFDLFTAEVVEQEGKKKKITVEEALGQKQFRKIYLMVGINELGTGDVERFEKTYREAVEHIRELQPDAIIYIESILKVTEKRSQMGDYITNQGIIDRNEAIKGIADGQTIFYLDVNEAVCDESGCLNPEYSGDGVHVTAKYIYLWKDYLMSHAIEM